MQEVARRQPFITFCIQNVLKQVVGHWSLNPKALRSESGEWDTVTRIDMLVLRFFTKICSSDPDSLISRVVRMSMDNLSNLEYNAPDKKWSASNRIHQQPWAQCVLASTERLGVPKEWTKSMLRPSLLLIIQEHRQDEHEAEVWVTVQSPTTYVPT